MTRHQTARFWSELIARQCRLLCSGRKGCRSVFCFNEYHSGRRSRSKSYCYGDTSRKDGKVNQSLWRQLILQVQQKFISVGGVQAIAALAFGTKSIPKVNKIAGPEIFTLRLQRRLYMVMSASTALLDLVRSWFLQMRGKMQSSLQDLLSQAELATSLPALILVTTSMELMRKYQSLQKNLSQDYPEKRFCKSPLIIMVIFL